MTPPRLLVTGGTGLVGSALLAAAAGRFAVHATVHKTPPVTVRAPAATWHALDVRDASACRALVSTVHPAVVVHAAIDVAPGALEPVVVAGSAHVAAAAHAAGAAHLHLSSDMVFAGDDTTYDEDAPLRPVSPYGRAKAQAEGRVRDVHPEATIARLPLLYRIDPPDRAFAAWLSAAREGRGYPMFVDEIRCPAHVDDVAQALLLLATALHGADALPGAPPIAHLPGPVAISRYDLAVGMLRALGLPPSLAVPGRHADAPEPRPRALVFVPRRTPAVFTAPLRPPAAWFEPVRPTPPAAR